VQKSQITRCRAVHGRATLLKCSVAHNIGYTFVIKLIKIIDFSAALYKRGFEALTSCMQEVYYRLVDL